MFERIRNIPLKIRFAYLGLLFVMLAGGLAVGVRLAQQPVRAPKATVGAGAASLSFFGSTSVTEGQSLPVSISVSAPETLDPAGGNGIIGVQAVFTFDNTILNLDPNNIVGNLCDGVNNCHWSYPIINVTPNGSTSTVEIAAVYSFANQDGDTRAASASIPFATLGFTTVGAGSGSLDWDTNLSKINNKQNDNVISSSLSGLAYTINSNVQPSDTPTPTQEILPSDTPTPTIDYGNPTATPTTYVPPSDTPTPTTGSSNGATNSCNGTCGSNNNCNPGLYCYQGYCRNPSCPSDAACGCSAPTATPRPTATPTSGSISYNNPTPTTYIYPTTATTGTQTYYGYPTVPPGGPTPTLSPDYANNPFLGGTRPTGEQVPATSATHLSWLAALLLWITNLLHKIFGSR